MYTAKHTKRETLQDMSVVGSLESMCQSVPRGLELLYGGGVTAPSFPLELAALCDLKGLLGNLDPDREADRFLPQ